MHLGREIESMELEPLDATPAPAEPLPDAEPVGPTVTDPVTGEVSEHDPVLVER